VVTVQLGGDLLVVEGFLLHHVAPVAGRVADAEENRPGLAPGPLEGLLAPGGPVDGGVRVLGGGGAVLEGEAVGVLGRAVRVPVSRARLVARPLRRQRLAKRRGDRGGR